MFHRQLAFLASAALLAVAAACSQSPGTVEKKSESTTQTPEGAVTTKSETKQVGSTLEAKSETKADTPAGAVAAKTETFVGTVTVFLAGKKIEVMTGEKKMHTFDLDDKDVVTTVDRSVLVGKRVTVTDETGTDKVRHLTVRLTA
jgi:hypothetical protein